ncbi:MAG: HAD-IG family 5'-nucleotidase [Planctomycetes bacterium]|nr:HAD-IG family 5'-nucleotidase [Planctomycetota bacterium]
MTGTDPFAPPPHRAVFCNRTLNMRSIQAVGFDMDYTLVHYDVHAWEARAFAHVQQRLQQRGLPADALRFQPEQFARGLIVDKQLGNLVKANRFGYVTQAAHGTRLLPHDEQRRSYSQVWVDLSESRWVFLNTLFSLSEACLYGQLVDLLDAGRLPAGLDYAALHGLVASTMDAAHLEGALKAEIIADPARFVPPDAELVQTLRDLKHAGKKLFLATNSEWHYTEPMMRWAFDRHLGGSWRELFDLVIVQAKKPGFFDGEAPFVEIRDGVPAATPHTGRLLPGHVYRGGNAGLVERHFGLPGEAILYVGDHVYADVHVSSQIRRWRTALILRELEDELAAEQSFAAGQAELHALMAEKDRHDREQAMLRLCLQRLEHGEPLPAGCHGPATAIHERLRTLRGAAEALDQRIAPLAKAAGELAHSRWGLLLRAGNDKSRLARQIERHADVYTSRVANFLHVTPFGYLRAARGSLPHDVRPA